jgi:hypothetical protein
MTTAPDDDKPGTEKAGNDKRTESDRRHVYGPRPVGALMPAVIKPAFRRRNAASARILADWEAIMGPALAAVTIPRKLAAGTLTVGCSGPIALELQHLSDQVTARINAHLGSTAVLRLRLVQEARPLTSAQRPSAIMAVADTKVDAALAPIAAGPLRDSLARLGRRVLARTVR